MDKAQLLAEIERLKAQTEALKKQMGRKISYKVSEKGAISIYGFGRFPLTIYPKNLQTLFSMQKELTDYMESNKATLSWERRVA